MMTGKNKLHCTLLKWNRHSLATNLNQLQRLRLKTDEQSGSIQVENMQFDRSSLFPHFSYVSLTTCVTLALLCHSQFQYEPHESGAKNNYPNWQRCGIKSGTPKASGTFNDGQFRIKWTPAYLYRRNKHNGMVMEIKLSPTMYIKSIFSNRPLWGVEKDGHPPIPNLTQFHLNSIATDISWSVTFHGRIHSLFDSICLLQFFKWCV